MTAPDGARAAETTPGEPPRAGWLPDAFGQRVGAALAAPTRALRVAGSAPAAGKAGSDAALLIALAFIAIHTRELATAVWLGAAEGVRVGLASLVGALSRAVLMDLAFLFFGALAVSILAGRRRNLGRDFDLACVAFVPVVTVDVVATLIVRVADVRISDSVSTAVSALAYGWGGAILLLALIEARRGQGREPVGQATAGGGADTPAHGSDADRPGDAAQRRAPQAVRSRRAAAALAAAGAAVFAVNTLWIADNLDVIQPISPGDVAPGFALPHITPAGQLSADRTRLDDLRGDVILVDFWATWCGPCRESMPAIERVYRAHRERGLHVVSVNTDDPAKARQFAASLGLTFPLVFDDSAVAHRYRVTTIPHMVLIDRLGVIRHVHRGVTGERELSRQVERLLAQPRP